jgi:hypothetical protein
MDSNEKLVIEGREEAFVVEGDDKEERVFTVGELVEYWGGAFVRGYQTCGEPAFVKRVEGGGKYAIKMVGSGRGKYRLVEWRQLFKDGAFNQHKGDSLTRTVRTRERIKEQATGEAEAKFGGQLRRTRLKLHMSEKRLKEKEVEAENRVNRAAMEARKELKDLTAGHKRQLGEMEEETRRGMQTLREGEEEKARETRQCIRQLRQELRDLTELLGTEKEVQAQVDKELVNEQKKRTRLMDDVETWKEICEAQEKRTAQREERILHLRDDVSRKKREIKTLETLVESRTMSNELEVETMLHERNDLEQKLTERKEDIIHLELEVAEVRLIISLIS